MEHSEPKLELGDSFYQRYSGISDAQILEILRNHKDYQEAAVNAAVKIAVERGLIHSDQDLLAPEFQNSPVKGFTLFPEITNAYHQKQLTGSIFRFLYLMSLIPVIYGFLKYAEGQIDQTILGVGIGLSWFVLSFLLQKKRRKIILVPQFILLASILIFVGITAFDYETLKILDLVILFIGILLPVYLLLYLNKLFGREKS
ncbi:MAG: hypothetical protein WAO52_03155 [Prolixibacteraceae bacterium]